MKKYFLTLLFAIAFPINAAQSTVASVEFLHWWTSAGEVRAANIAKQALEEANVHVEQQAIQGGGGDTAMSILQARAIAGTPPTIAQLEGPAIQSWAALGFLYDLEQLANQEHWRSQLYPIARAVNQFEGRFVATPVTIHRLNWMWVNHDVLRQYSLSPPDNWEALIDTFKTLKRHNVQPLAIGNDQWQIALLFENLAFGYGGADYYRRAFMDMDEHTLRSATTFEVLSLFREISRLIQPTISHIRWDEATQLLIEGKHAFQFSGDWVLGELLAKHVAAPEAIGCYQAPAKHTGFIYNMDSFALFNSARSSRKTANTLARALSSKAFLTAFNQAKGALPARKDIDLSQFNPCSRQAHHDMEQAEQNGRLLPSTVDSMAVSPIVQQATTSEIYRYFNDESIGPEEFILRLENIPRGK